MTGDAPARRHLFILNPAAGSVGIGLPDLIRKKFPGATILHTRGPGDAAVLAREAVLSPGDVVVACGGDGTFREAAEGVIGRATLAHVPVGTVCMVGRELGISKNPGVALEAVARGEALDIYPGRVVDETGTERLFFLAVSAGPDGDAVHLLRPAEKRRIGRYAYVLALLRRLAQPIRPSIPCQAAGERLTLTEAVALRMPWYAGPYRLGRRVSLFQPGIELAGVDGGRWRLLRFFAAILLGGRLFPTGTRHIFTERATLYPPDGRCQIDGDAFLSRRLDIHADPRPLRVICGRVICGPRPLREAK
jgi:diacylglycerol kinase family enzyme